MSIFKREIKDEKDLKAAMREDVTVNIEPYAPHQNLSAVPYLEPRAMADLKLNFESQVNEFLNKTNPDQYNSTFVDRIVVRAREQALSDLDIQRTEHAHTIERSIASLWKGDQYLYEKMINDYDEEYEERLKELKQLKMIYYKGTSYEEFSMEV